MLEEHRLDEVPVHRTLLGVEIVGGLEGEALIGRGPFVDTTIAAAEVRTAELHGVVGSWEHWQRQQPEATRRLARLETDIARLDRQLAPEVELEPAVGWDLRLFDLGLRPPTPEPPGPDLGLGLGL